MEIMQITASKRDEGVNTIGAEEHGHGNGTRKYQSIIAIELAWFHEGIAKESWSESRATWDEYIFCRQGRLHMPHIAIENEPRYK